METWRMFLWNTLSQTHIKSKRWGDLHNLECDATAQREQAHSKNSGSTPGVKFDHEVSQQVTRTMNTKHQRSVINTSEYMSHVKVFVTDGGTDEWF